jgi:dipeptidyl aminopeptidase/acylaminoacyl peptidase
LENVGTALARKGIAALYFKLPYYGDRNGGQGQKGLARAAAAKDILAFFHQAVADVRRARDVLAAMPGVDSRRVGVLGVSLGAVIAATAAGVDPTFPYVILVVGGADLAKIIFHGSDETKFMADKLSKEGMDEAKTREFFKEVDPATHAGRIGADHCLLVHMKHDEVFPKESVDLLADKIGKPTRISYDGKHTWVAIYAMAIVDETKKFVDGR